MRQINEYIYLMLQKNIKLFYLKRWITKNTHMFTLLCKIFRINFLKRYVTSDETDNFPYFKLTRGYIVYAQLEVPGVTEHRYADRRMETWQQVTRLKNNEGRKKEKYFRIICS